jgi:ankyrin repeat protein
MARTSRSQTPLHIAVEMAESRWAGREHDYGLAIQLLLGAGARLDALDAYGAAPLHVAAKNLDCATIDLLLAHGADVRGKVCSVMCV